MLVLVFMLDLFTVSASVLQVCAKKIRKALSSVMHKKGN